MSRARLLQLHKERLKWPDSPAGSGQRMRTMPTSFSFSLSLCVRNSLSATGGHLPQLQACGPSLSTGSLNSGFLQLNLAPPGEVRSSLDCREPRNKSCRSCAFQLKAVVTTRSHSLRTRSSGFGPSFISEQSKINGLSFFFTSPMTKFYHSVFNTLSLTMLILDFLWIMCLWWAQAYLILIGIPGQKGLKY